MEIPQLNSEFEGVVENGQIRLAPDVHLPDKTEVIVIVQPRSKVVHIGSPRLVHRGQAARFFMKVVEVIEDKPNAGV